LVAAHCPFRWQLMLVLVYFFYWTRCFENNVPFDNTTPIVIISVLCCIAVFVWLVAVCSSEVISGRFVLWILFNNSLSAARSHQNPPTASTKDSLSQQKYRRSRVLCSSWREGVWVMDWSCAGMFVKFRRMQLWQERNVHVDIIIIIFLSSSSLMNAEERQVAVYCIVVVLLWVQWGGPDWIEA